MYRRPSNITNDSASVYCLIGRSYKVFSGSTMYVLPWFKYINYIIKSQWFCTKNNCTLYFVRSNFWFWYIKKNKWNKISKRTAFHVNRRIIETFVLQKRTLGLANIFCGYEYVSDNEHSMMVHDKRELLPQNML